MFGAGAEVSHFKNAAAKLKLEPVIFKISKRAGAGAINFNATFPALD